MNTQIQLHTSKKVLATFSRVSIISTTDHPVLMHDCIEAGSPALILLAQKDLVRYLTLSRTTPYLFLFFDEDDRFDGATFSLNKQKVSFQVSTQAKKVLALPFPTSFDSIQIHTIERISQKEN